MEKTSARKAIEETAKNRGISTAEVIFEIEAAIYTAYQQALENKDQDLLEIRAQIPRAGQLPNAEEFISHICSCIFSSDKLLTTSGF